MGLGVGGWILAAAMSPMAASHVGFGVPTPYHPVARAWQPAQQTEPRLGVTLGVRDAALGGADGAGAPVDQVADDGGAAKAGLQAGDLIVAFDSEPVRDATHLIGLLQGQPFAAVVRLGVRRQERHLDLDVRLDLPDLVRLLPARVARMTREGPYLRMLPRGGARRLGVTVQELTPQLAAYLGARGGVLVTSVREWSPAGRAGLRAGCVITRADRRNVRTVADVSRILDRDLTNVALSLAVTFNGRDQIVTVKFAP